MQPRDTVWRTGREYYWWLAFGLAVTLTGGLSAALGRSAWTTFLLLGVGVASVACSLGARRMARRGEGAHPRNLISRVPCALWWNQVDAAGAVAEGYLSPGGEDLLGLPRGSLRSSFDAFLSHVVPEDRDRLLSAMARALASAPCELSVEFRVRRSDGQIRWLAARAAAVRQPSDGIIGYGVTSDVTDRVRAEEALRASEQQLRSLIAGLPDVVMRFDREHRHTFVSENVRETTLFEAADFLGKTHHEMPFAREMADFWEEAIERVFTTGEPHTTEFSLEGPSGPARYEWRLSPERDEAGVVRSVLAIARDVTPLRTSEGHLRALIAGLPDVVMRFDRECRHTFVSENVRDATPFEAPAFLGRTHHEMGFPPAMSDFWEAAIRTAFERQAPYTTEFEIEAPHGLRRFEWRLTPERDADGQVRTVLAIARDITEQRLADDEIAATNARLAAILRTAPVGLALIRLRAIEAANDLFCEMLGYAPGALTGVPTLQLFEGEEARAAINDILVPQVEATGYGEAPGRFVRADGSVIEVMVYMSSMDRADPTNPEAVAVVDVTDKLRAEEEARQLREAAERTQRLESVGVLAGGIAHDFNNLLAAIMGNGELALLAAPETGPQRRRLEQIVRAGARARDLVKQMLAFSRQHEARVRTMSPGPVVGECLRFLRASLPATIEFDEDISPSCPDVVVDPTQLHQVLMNLGANAGYAMRSGGGVLTVRMAECCLDDHGAHEVGLPAPGRYARLTVRDTGVGMDAETLDRAFEPFFSTKPEGEGTGLGLSTVHGIVSDLGGAIAAASAPGAGATFDVYLPAADGEAEEERGAEVALPRGSECVMVLDDEPAVAMVAAEVLGMLGYTVATYTDSREALAAFAREPDRYDLVVTDHTMPHCTGAQLIHALRELRPGLPVVIVTGMPARALRELDPRLAEVALLPKPYEAYELARVAREALDEARG